MRKIILSVIFAIVLSVGASAQTDNIVADWNEPYRSALSDMPWIPPFAVGNIVNDTNAYAPLGDGLLILTVLGTGYFLRKKKIKNNI